ncbi:MAG: PAN domain-containing protein [Flavobacterium sp.]
MKDYISELNNSTNPTYKSPLVSISGYQFNGTASVGSDINLSTPQECQARCAQTTTCSGATFVSPRCMLKTGDSSVVASTSSSYAIVSKEKQLLLRVETLNTQLLSVNNAIRTLIENSKPNYRVNKQKSVIENAKLLTSYNQLMTDRQEIEDLLAEENSLANVDHTYEINKHYYSYCIWTIILVIILWAGFRLLISTYTPPPTAIQYGGDLGVSAYYGVAVLVIVVILFNRTVLA